MLRRLNPFYKKKTYKKSYKFDRLKPMTEDISYLTDRVHELERKLDALTAMSGFKVVRGVIMDEQDAKKYKEQDSFIF